MLAKEGPSTRSVHSCRRIDSSTHAIVPPVCWNSAFAYENMEAWLGVTSGKTPGYTYSRNSNPTTTALEEKMASLEGTQSATSFATGMAAVSTTLFALLSPSRRVVTVRDLYGATYRHFTEILPRFGVVCEVCETQDRHAIETAIAQGCDLLFIESPTNPTLKVLDVERLSTAAKRAGAITVVDNTFATPVNQSPIELGADLVIHSATKYLSGHGDVLGGIACGRNELINKIYRYRELTGASMDAQVAYVILRSLKTLGLRVQRHNENALTLARFLEEQPKVERVHYPGLESHPGHEIAAKQMSGFGGVLSFELEGGFEAVRQFLPQLQYAYMAANLGQVETIVGPPATTSHVELTAEERAATGIPEGLIRYAVGIEDAEDLRADLEQALAKL